MGHSIHSGTIEFEVPNEYPITASGWRIDENGRKYIQVKGIRWFTNIEHGNNHNPLSLMTMKENLLFSKHKEIKSKNGYYHYDNYDAIEIPFTDAIPSDYDGIMGVPISFLDKYCPEQFEILGMNDRLNGSCFLTKKYTASNSIKYNDLNSRSVIKVDDKYISTYARLFIRKL